ncbi:M56 family metallopeptidase [Pedobacter sp. UC225_61]|uniref:M56 family metallopeptidase n=1 Tax=Pedobacter sp. UC225_61 TaxID=3374623 RepID=UPI0037AA3901
MEWLIYLFKVSVCSGLFFAFYLLFLRKLTFFKANRFYLLAALVLSFIIPTLNFKVERAAPEIVNRVVFQQETPIANGTQVATPIVTQHLDWQFLLISTYKVLVAGLLFIAACRLFQLLSFTRQPTREINGLKLVSKTDGFTNCSFFNYVFIDQDSLTDEELELLLKHEEVHAKQYHSFDKLLLMITKAILWFNPIIYLYDKALEQTHEYEADEVTSQDFGTAPYATLLLKLAVVRTNMPLIHNFVKSPLKERIKMLYNSKSKDMKKFRYVLAMPIGLVLVWGFAVNVVYAQSKENEVKEVRIEGKTVPLEVKEVPIKVSGVQIKATGNTVFSGNAVRATEKRGEVAEVVVTGRQAITERVAGVERLNAISVNGGVITEVRPSVDRLTGVTVTGINNMKAISVHDGVITTGVQSIASTNARVTGIKGTQVFAAVTEQPIARSRKANTEEEVYYERYTEIGRSGEAHDVAVIKTAKGSSAAIELPRNGKVMIYIDGVPYTESQAAGLKKVTIEKYNKVSACEKGGSEFSRLYPELVGKYDGVLELRSN